MLLACERRQSALTLRSSEDNSRAILAIGDVNRPLWHDHTVAIAAPSDGPPTSLDVGVGIAGANPNRIPLALPLSICICLPLSLSLFVSFLPLSRSTIRAFLPGRIIDRSPKIHQVAASRTYFAPPRRSFDQIDFRLGEMDEPRPAECTQSR